MAMEIIIIDILQDIYQSMCHILTGTNEEYTKEYPFNLKCIHEENKDLTRG
jgi:hypothetical protein